MGLLTNQLVQHETCLRVRTLISRRGAERQARCPPVGNVSVRISSKVEPARRGAARASRHACCTGAADPSMED